MNPERHRQIGDLYHDALELGAGERAAFLDRECAGDRELRREVESLLALSERAGDFLAAPALGVAAGLLAGDESDAMTGRTFGRYRVLSLVGAGGMGRVYLAEDTELGRRVALKLLPEYFTHDKGQVQRFRQEARAASALNHPNILTVYEVGEADGAAFIAMEYVEGETLRAKLAGASWGVREALDAAAQMADALSAAHRAGIIHRDVKPENVMVRRDGYVKVLDFGLAKLTESLAGPQRAGSESPTIPAIRTNPGVVMGTAEYMSPEQARGLVVDARADVWSLGVIIYEMVSGLRPFGGETHGDTIVSILEREPEPLRHRAPGAPAELERIVQKALAKDAEERYQTAKDMAIDLKRLKKRLEAEAEFGRYAPPGGDGEAVSTGGQAVAGSAAGQGVTQTGRAVDGATTSSLEYAVTEIRRHKAGAALAGILLIVVLAGGAYGIYRLLNREEAQVAAPFQDMKITRVTGDGTAVAAALSPDGRFAAYVLKETGRETLRVRQVETASDLLLVPPTEVIYVGLTFSPDGDYLYYVILQGGGAGLPRLESDSSGTLYRVPVLGGAARKIMAGVDSPVSFSPGGAQFAFIRRHPERGETALMVADADGNDERRLAARPNPDVYLSRGNVGGSGPAWSPDGKVIVCGVGRFARQQVVAVSALDGSERPLGSQSWQSVGRLAWLPSGSGLVMNGMDQRLSKQLWHLSYPAGELRRITNDLNEYSHVSLDADASSLVAVQADAPTQYLWVLAPGGDPGRATKVASRKGVGDNGLSWTPDGRIVYVASEGDRLNLWVVNHDGTGQKQLTAFTNPINVRPNVCPNGRYVLFVSDRAGARNIWRVDIDGSNPVRLTSGELDTWPTCSPDGRWVIYASRVSGQPSLWKVAIDGGAPSRLTNNNYALTYPSVSPDGKLVAYINREEREGSVSRLVVMPFDGGEPVKTFELPPTATSPSSVRWTPDGRGLTYVDTYNDFSNVWSQPLEGGAPRQITDFASEEIFVYDWSRDGKRLALWRGTTSRDVVLISDFK